MAHAHHASVEVPPRLSRLLRTGAIGGAVAVLLGLVLLRPGDISHLRSVVEIDETYDARVVAIDELPCPGQAGVAPAELESCYNVDLDLLAGPDEGDRTRLLFPISSTTPDLDEGRTVVLGYEPDAPEDNRYFFFDQQRRAPLLWLALLFAAAVVALGRLRGLAALVGLAFTVVVLISFVLPAVLSGRDPVLVAIFGGAAITFVTLYLAHGFTHMTTVALAGTIGSLALTAILAQIFVGLTNLSGFASEESIVIQLSATELDLQGIVLAGMVLGALGALDDVTVTQASAIWELRSAAPGSSMRELYRRGLRVGRDHIASTVNTLLLAYAGASLPLLLFFVVSRQPLLQVANGEVVATEIVRTLVGSIGLAASVPLTTWFAAFIATRADEERGAQEPPPEPTDDVDSIAP